MTMEASQFVAFVAFQQHTTCSNMLFTRATLYQIERKYIIGYLALSTAVSRADGIVIIAGQWLVYATEASLSCTCTVEIDIALPFTYTTHW